MYLLHFSFELFLTAHKSQMQSSHKLIMFYAQFWNQKSFWLHFNLILLKKEKEITKKKYESGDVEFLIVQKAPLKINRGTILNAFPRKYTFEEHCRANQILKNRQFD